MNSRTRKLSILVILPVALSLIGCWTDPARLKPATGSPSFVGGMVVVNSRDVTAMVESVDANRRELVLSHADGILSTNIAGPAVINFDRIKAGDEVKASIGTETGVFVVKNGPLPSAGGGVLVEGAAKEENPAGVLVATHDISARVIAANRSHRLLTLKYAGDEVKTFKVPLPFTLEHVQVGDNVVVRTAAPLPSALCQMTERSGGSAMKFIEYFRQPARSV